MVISTKIKGPLLETLILRDLDLYSL